jgi:isopenicillin N synthase-like dioxygenase
MKHNLIIPKIDLSEDKAKVVASLKAACRDYGFFLLADHETSETLQTKLEVFSKNFFALSTSEKMKISMERGGLAWRGFFPVGNELTSGKTDLKEGIYFGEELTLEDARVASGLPLHGKNLFPEVPGFREAVLEYMEHMKTVGHRLMSLISLSLDLDEDYFEKHYTSEPTQLFRIFHYPPTKPEIEADFPWGVGEHTDYGLLTILKQDEVGGLEVKVGEHWVNVPPTPGTLVCNVGDMLDYLTQGYYRSAPHRVKNASGKERYSYPYFFDPGFVAPIKALPIRNWSAGQKTQRWDQENLYQFQGTYGEYLLKKVSKVFPELATQNEITKR